MAKFFETKTYEQFVNLTKVLGFTEDEVYPTERRFRWFQKHHFQLTVVNDATFRLYKEGRCTLSGSVHSAEDQARLIEASRDKMYKTLEDWLASRVTAAATYRRQAEKRAEETRREMLNLELSIMRAHHDLRKTAQIAKEGHQ